MQLDRTALALAFLAALLWAATQVTSSLYIDSVPTVLFIALIECWCIAVACIFLIFRRQRAAVLLKLIWDHPKILRQIAYYSVAIFIYEFSFYYALHDQNKLLPIVISSMWPLFTVIWGRALKVWKFLSVRDTILVLLAFAGAFLITSARYNYSLSLLNPLVVGLSFLAAISGGLWDPFATQAAIKIQESEPDTVETPNHKQAIFSQIELIALVLLLARVLALPLYAVALFKWGHVSGSMISANIIAVTGAIALVGYILADIFFTVAIFRGRNATVVSTTFLVPMLAAVIFWMVRDQSVSAVTLIGLYAIFLSNLLLHTQAARLPPTSAAAILFILIACGAIIIDPASVAVFIGSQGFGPGLQLIMGVVTLVLGFVLQQTDARIREERTQFSGLLKAVSELDPNAPHDASVQNLAAAAQQLRSLRVSRRSAVPIQAQSQEFVQSLVAIQTLPKIKVAQLVFAFEQWLAARRNVEDLRETWFFGVVVFAVAFSVVLNSVTSRWLAVLSAAGASLLCYLWMFLVNAMSEDTSTRDAFTEDN
jgi:drug/metabolite transporter (DMT)-like permease